MFAFDAKLSTAVVSDHTPPPPKPANKPLSDETVARLQRYWQAANYLTVGQIYLRENPLLKEPLTPDHIKPRLLGHWGATPGPLHRVQTHDLPPQELAQPAYGTLT